MKKNVLALFLAMILCAYPVCAVEGTGFSVDIPEDWTAADRDDGTYEYDSPDESISFVVIPSDNEDGGNPFDLSEEDMIDVADEIGDSLRSQLEQSMTDQDFPCRVEERKKDLRLTEWGDGQPAVLLDASFDVRYDDEESGEMVFPLYLYFGILLAKEHCFCVGYITTSQEALQTARDSGVMESFRITEAVFDAPTAVATWEDVLFRVGGYALIGAVGGLIWHKASERRKAKKTEEKADSSSEER